MTSNLLTALSLALVAACVTNAYETAVLGASDNQELQGGTGQTISHDIRAHQYANANLMRRVKKETADLLSTGVVQAHTEETLARRSMQKVHHAKADINGPGDPGLAVEDAGVDRRRAGATPYGRRRRVDYGDTEYVGADTHFASLPERLAAMCGDGRRRAGKCCYRRRQVGQESVECQMDNQLDPGHSPYLPPKPTPAPQPTVVAPPDIPDPVAKPAPPPGPPNVFTDPIKNAAQAVTNHIIKHIYNPPPSPSSRRRRRRRKLVR